jgi:hypothetical protein
MDALLPLCCRVFVAVNMHPDCPSMIVDMGGYSGDLCTSGLLFLCSGIVAGIYQSATL